MVRNQTYSRQVSKCLKFIRLQSITIDHRIKNLLYYRLSHQNTYVFLFKNKSERCLIFFSILLKHSPAATTLKLPNDFLHVQWYETWCLRGARIWGLVFWIWYPLLIYRLPSRRKRAMYVVANFVGMEFNIFNFLWIISHSFFFLRWGMTG